MADYLGWRWEFGVQVPILALSLIVAVVTIPSDLGLHGREKQPIGEAMKTFDFRGSFLMSISVTFLILGLVSLVSCELSSPTVLTGHIPQSLGGNVLPCKHTYPISD